MSSSSSSESPAERRPRPWVTLRYSLPLGTFHGDAVMWHGEARDFVRWKSLVAMARDVKNARLIGLCSVNIETRVRPDGMALLTVTADTVYAPKKQPRRK